MNDRRKTKAQLLDELAALRQRVAELENRSASTPDRSGPPAAAPHEGEELFRAAIEFLPIPIAVADTSGSIFYLNQRFTERYGYTIQDLPTINAWMMRAYPDPAYREEVATNWNRRIEDSISHDLPTPVREFNVTCKDGSQRIVEITARGIQGLILASFNDITERRRAEDAVRKSQALLQETASIGNIGGWEIDIDTLEQTWTEQVYRIHEVNPDFKPTVKAGIEFYAPDARAIIEKAIEDAIKFGKSFDVELPFITAKGKHRWVHAIGTSDLEHRRVHGFFQDITERKLVEAALRESEFRFRSLYESMTELSAIHEIVYDSTGTAVDYRILDCNPAFEQITGIPRQQAIGAVASQLYGTDEPPYFDIYLKVAQTGEPSSFETEFIPMGKTFSISVFSPQRGRFVTVATDITNRKRVEEALRASEDKFHTAFLVSPDAININRLNDGLYISINRGFTQIMGYTEADVAGKTSLNLDIWVNVEDRQRLVAGLRQAGMVENLDAPFRAKDGHVVDGLMSASIMELDGVPHILSVTRDISARKQAEQRIQYYTRLYATLSQVNQTIVRVTDRSTLFDAICHLAIEYGKFRMAWIGLFDPVTGQLTAVAEDGQGGQRLSVGTFDLYVEPFRSSMLAAAVTSGQVQINNDVPHDPSMAYWHAVARRDGHQSAATIPIRQRGQVIGLLNLFAADVNFFAVVEEQQLLAEMGLDISFALDTLQGDAERRQAEQALRNSEEKYRLLVDTASEGVWVLDQQHHTSYVNAALAKMLGYAPADIIGYPIENFLFAEDFADHEQRVARRHVGQDESYERRFKRRDGSVLWTLVSARAILDGAGEFSGSFAMFTDITERKRAESEILQLNAELEQRVAQRTRELAAANERLTELDQLKSKFVSDVSHELRTPVTSLALYIDLLDHGKPEKREQYMVQLKNQMARLRKLINDILDLSRLERDRDEGERSLVDLNLIVEHVSAMERGAAEAAGLTLICEVAKEAPLVFARADQLTRAITNLVSNAIKYTPAGSVQVRTCVQNNRIGVQVADTGLGIPADELPHLFDRFYRGRAVAQSNIPGTGLGLSIVKEIAESHGGTVEVESTVGVGSVFHIWLPVAG